ncbi:MAG: type I-E CRISPR-associated protein Cse1/CasA [Bradymonadaceae bacterium]
MSSTAYSVLSDPLFSVGRADGTSAQATLPQILAELSTGTIGSFEALQAHQKQAWYSFLVQTAAMAVAREGGGDLPETPEAWRELLLALGGGGEEPWCLIVEDVEQPAFFQPPVPEGALEEAGFDLDIETPDDLDMLITAKNHDLKRHRIRRPDPEHWIYALVTLQTLEGFLGRGNYGIARMNGGFGNRPLLGVTPDLDWGSRFRRDVRVLLDERDESTADRYDGDGHALLWIEPWDGSKDDRIPLRDCDPYFVEICRRLRFREGDDGELQCWRTNTKDYRIDGVRDRDGVTGDPWTPIDETGPKALTVSGSGFHYERLYDILFDEEFERPPALEFRGPESEGGYLLAATLVRGQGETEGLHRRRVPVSENVSRLFAAGETQREQLGRRAKERIATTDAVERNVLYPSLAALLQAGQDRDVDYDDVSHWIDHFDDAVDEIFFEELWRSFDEGMSDEEATLDWQETLFELAEQELERAIGSCPMPSILRYRAISAAKSRFWAAVREQLPEYASETFDTDESSTPREESDERARQ